MTQVYVSFMRGLTPVTNLGVCTNDICRLENKTWISGQIGRMEHLSYEETS